jgi:Helicase HerA, central domain
MSLRSAERPGHRCTTRHAQAIYPFVSTGGLGGRGVFVGRDSSGGAFCYDPWVLYGEGTLDDPNAIVLGKLGQGKSALVKTLLWRMLLFGRRALVLDVKREYGPLCAAVGVTPLSLEPGGGIRLNPLASRPEEHAQLELLRAVTMTAVGGPLSQVEAAALREALHAMRVSGVAEPTLPQIARVLFDPVAEMAERLRTTSDRLAYDTRRAALAIQDLCEGPLRGMFDGPTTPGIDLDARLLVLDLHAVKDSPAVGILMACATAWMSALLARMAERPGRERLINVADESWTLQECSRADRPPHREKPGDRPHPRAQQRGPILSRSSPARHPRSRHRADRPNHRVRASRRADGRPALGPQAQTTAVRHHEESYSRQEPGRDHRLDRQPVPAQPAASRRGPQAAA